MFGKERSLSQRKCVRERERERERERKKYISVSLGKEILYKKFTPPITGII